MEIIYKGQNKIRRAINKLGATALILYAVGGSIYNSTKTGHPSADIATGRSQPTALERLIMNGLSAQGTALSNAVNIYSPMPLVK